MTLTAPAPESTTWTDDQLLEAIAAATWHQSPGYVAPDCQQVGPHEYILVKEYPDLFNGLYHRARRDGGYRFTYNGKTHYYVDLGGFKYWCCRCRFVMNREALAAGPRSAELEACLHRVTFRDQQHALSRMRRVTARAGGLWRVYGCRTCGGWHITPLGGPAGNPALT